MTDTKTDSAVHGRKPRLAIIGTGIAGLSAAWLLKDKFAITVYESQPRAGMGVFTVDYLSNGIETRVDVPLRIFCRGYYDHLLALYREIGVEVESSDHSGAFADGDRKLFFHYGNLDVGSMGFSLPKGKSLVSPRAWRIALQSQWFFKRAQLDLRWCRNLSEQTFGEYLKKTRAGQSFVDGVLLPILSVTCTCDYQSVLNYPADMMLGYLTCGVREFGIMSAAKGVDDIVPRLLQGVEVKTSCAVARVVEAGDGLRVEAESGEIADFDHVVVASQAQQAASMLDGFEAQRELLAKVPFETSTMSVHTDRGLLPKATVPLSPVTYVAPEGATRAEVSVDLTKAISRFRHQAPVFQTWNPIADPVKGAELTRVQFTRPVVTHESREAMAQLRQLQQQPSNNLWFCGSYLADKIPLLDAAVDSTVAIARSLGVTAPWLEA
ncbi:MAG: NAD(P)-binding protein [Candidatus Pelagadaptatus aseana]|uniref:FAD-dependent oxidoreductase n=1 Tax=Candidatus Pelagadaptatus aseana TaxID=3120508 RepID=UPI0039B2BA8A